MVVAEPTEYDSFGQAVDIDGDTLAIGAGGDDDGADTAGAAYVFVHDGTLWALQQKLASTDATSAGAKRLGDALALSGDTLLAGAAYVFVRSGTAWTQQARLVASDGSTGDELGFAVALDTDLAVIGTHLDDGGSADSGSVYVFVRSGTDWFENAPKLTRVDAENDRFGAAVAIAGDTVLVGTALADDAGADAGSVTFVDPVPDVAPVDIFLT